MAKNNSKLVTKVSPLIEGQVPDFIQADHPVFVNFLKDYFHLDQIFLIHRQTFLCQNISIMFLFFQ